MKRILLAVLLIVFFIPTYIYGKMYWIKTFGIHLKPNQVIQPNTSIDYFLQNDPLWAAEPLGTSSDTLGRAGCLISVLASSVNSIDKTNSFTPSTLNKLFTNKNVFDDRGNVIWIKIKEAIPNIDYHFQRNFGASTLEQDLTKNLLPIVKVKYRTSGIFHWVLVVGSNADDFLIVDPLNQKKTLLPLFASHGKVYSYRVLVKK